MHHKAQKREECASNEINKVHPRKGRPSKNLPTPHPKTPRKRKKRYNESKHKY
jgi:hypothetical protein